MFAHWCEAFAAHHLEEVRRFSEAWQGEASLLLRQGDPAAAGLYGDHERLHTVHPALLADRVARQHQQLSAGGENRGRHHGLDRHGQGYQRRDPAPP